MPDAPPPSSAARNDTFAAFGSRDFRLYQLTRFASVLGTQIVTAVVSYQLYELTRSKMTLAYVGLFQFLPAFLLSLVTGAVADRVDRRRILLVYYAVMTGAALALARLSVAVGAGAIDASHLWPFYGVLLVIGTARAFAAPASSALMPLLVPAEHLSNAVGWSSSIWQLSTIIGPMVGGAIFALLSATRVYLFTSILYAFSLGCAWAISIRGAGLDRKGRGLDALFAGVRYVRDNPMVLGSISLDLFAVLLGGAVALMPVYATEILHVGKLGFGALRSAPALGAALMGAWLAAHPIESRAGEKMFAGVALFGLATIVFGLSTRFWLSLLALFVIGAADMVSVVVRQMLVQIATPPEMRGRVSAVNLVFVGASNELGEFESGLTAEWLGTVPAVVVGGVGTLLVVAMWAWRFPALRRLDRLESVAPTAAREKPDADADAQPAEAKPA
jgi:MFS family permease